MCMCSIPEALQVLQRAARRLQQVRLHLRGSAGRAPRKDAQRSGQDTAFVLVR